MADEFDEIGADELTADEESLLKDFPELNELGEARRKFLGQAAALGLGSFALNLLAQEQILAEIPANENALFAAVTDENEIALKLKINGAEKSLLIDSRVTLLDALREKLALTGSKKGCDHGQCGAAR